MAMTQRPAAVQALIAEVLIEPFFLVAFFFNGTMCQNSIVVVHPCFGVAGLFGSILADSRGALCISAITFAVFHSASPFD